MKNLFLVFISSLFLLSCKHKIGKNDIQKLNGYWEIQKVTFEDGEDKDYKVNESYDYFEIKNDNKGIRKKVMPQLDGSFRVNDTYENVIVRFKNDKVFLDYSTSFSRWSEELLQLSDEGFRVRNKQKMEYYYVKTGPINLTGDGEKTK